MGDRGGSFRLKNAKQPPHQKVNGDRQHQERDRKLRDARDIDIARLVRNVDVFDVRNIRRLSHVTVFVIRLAQRSSLLVRWTKARFPSVILRFLSASVCVISWIVVEPSPERTIHEATRKRINQCQMIKRK
ncbi:MAG: hypothetical protein DMF71_15895 [Acidobacteria bacterium]|nr:MAG: hypothetical protein DMF71_15895 [Acidobacteriota bacterium]